MTYGSPINFLRLFVLSGISDAKDVAEAADAADIAEADAKLVVRGFRADMDEIIKSPECLRYSSYARFFISTYETFSSPILEANWHVLREC